MTSEELVNKVWLSNSVGTCWLGPWASCSSFCCSTLHQSQLLCWVCGVCTWWETNHSAGQSEMEEWEDHRSELLQWTWRSEPDITSYPSVMCRHSVWSDGQTSPQHVYMITSADSMRLETGNNKATSQSAVWSKWNGHNKAAEWVTGRHSGSFTDDGRLFRNVATLQKTPELLHLFTRLLRTTSLTSCRQFPQACVVHFVFCISEVIRVLNNDIVSHDYKLFRKNLKTELWRNPHVVIS